jgi:hypothetical protein
MKRRSSFRQVTEVLEEISRLASSNWLLNCVVLGYLCALLVSGIFTVVIVIVIQLTSLGDLGDFDQRTSETQHHRCRRQSALPHGLAEHRRSCGDVQSLVRLYASLNCSVCAPRAEGLNHMISDGKFRGTHRGTHRVTLGKRRLLQQLQDNLFDGGSNTYHHYYYRHRNPYRPKESRTTIIENCKSSSHRVFNTPKSNQNE